MAEIVARANGGQQQEHEAMKASSQSPQTRGGDGRKLWLVTAAAVTAGALLAATLLGDPETAIGYGLGAAAVAAFMVWRNNPTRREPFDGAGYRADWHVDDEYNLLHLEVQLESGETCSLLSQAHGNAGSAKLSNVARSSAGTLNLDRALGQKEQRIRRTSGGTIATAARPTSDRFELRLDGKVLAIDADKKTSPEEAAARMAPVAAELPPQHRVLAIAYAASRQWLWLPEG